MGHRRQNHQVPTNQVKVQKGQNSKQDSSTCQKVYHEGTMARLQNLLLLLLLVTPTILQIANPGSSLFVKAEEDEVEDEGVEEDDGVVEDETITEDEEEIALDKNVSPDADTTLFFTRPAQKAGGSVELPAGQIVEFLVGFANKGESEFVVDSLEASFRYPMDFTYHIQNFSAIPYGKTVKPDQEATVAYSFIPADAFAGRPIGLSVNLAYRDLEGNSYLDPVFNETVQIVEFDEGFDTEVFFMYVTLAAGVFLVLFLIYTFLPGSKGKKSAPVSKPVETGTTNDDVDYEWIPRSALKTPGSNKTSPRQRKANKRNAGSDTE